MLIADVHIKRVYQGTSSHDGSRWLVDPIWPRGKREEELALEAWYRDASPSHRLRRAWQDGEIDRETFERRYRRELSPGSLEPLLERARRRRLTLVSAERNLEASHLPILREVILESLRDDEAAADTG